MHYWAIDIHEVRRLALALPEAVEQAHWGNPSFRVGGKIFASLPDDEHVNVMIDVFEVEPVVREAPESCEELWWGKKLAGVRVSLKQAAPTTVRRLLEAAWRRRAPRRLVV